MLALPPSGRRVPPPPRTLLLVHRSYGLMRQSRVALLDFGFWPRSWSLPFFFSLLSLFLFPPPPAGCYQPLLLPGFSRRYLCKSVTGCLVPYPTVPPSALACFFLGVIGLPKTLFRSASRWYPRTRFFRGLFLEVADISLCSGLRVCSPPRSLLPLRIFPQGSRGFYIRV